MPGLLKHDARCAICGEDIVVLFRYSFPLERSASIEFVHHDPKLRNHTVRGSEADMDVLHKRLHEVPDGIAG